MSDYSDQIDLNRKKLLQAAQKHLPPHVYLQMADDTANHYVAYSIDVPGKVSFANNRDDRYDYKRRRCSTLGRFLVRNLGIKMAEYTGRRNDIGFPVFSDGPTENAIARTIADCIDLDDCFVLRDDIYVVYNDPNIVGSCMSGLTYVRWYEENGCKILCYRRPGEEYFYGRALVWEDKYIDRIYPNDPDVVSAFRTYAAKHDMRALIENTRGSYWGDDGLISKKMKLPSSGKYPYLDTLCWIKPGKDYVLISTREEDGVFVMNNTNGELPRLCSECNCFDYDGYLEYQGLYLCSDCGSRLNWCDGCNQYLEAECVPHGFGQMCPACVARGVEQCVRCSGVGRRNNNCDHRTASGGRLCCNCHDLYTSGVWLPDNEREPQAVTVNPTGPVTVTLPNNDAGEWRISNYFQCLPVATLEEYDRLYTEIQRQGGYGVPQEVLANAEDGQPVAVIGQQTVTTVACDCAEEYEFDDFGDYDDDDTEEDW